VRRHATTPSTSAPTLDTRAASEILGVLRVMPPAPTPRGAPSPAPLGLLSGHIYPIAADAVTLGRDLGNNAVLLDPAVSRFQALIERGPAGWTIANLSGQQPIGLDAAALAPGQSAALHPGATLQLGATRLEWLTPRQPIGHEDAPDDGPDDAQSETPPRRAAAPRMLAPGVTLQFAIRAPGGRGIWWALALAGLALLLVGGILTLATALLIGRQALGSSGVGRVVAAIALPFVPALAIALLVTLIDRYEREPLSLLLLAFLWGALIAIPIALFAERAVEAALSAPGVGSVLTQALSAGLLEEGVKGAGLLLLLLALRDQFDNVTDGIVYGLIIGAGFALVENFAYLALSPASAFPGLILDRILLSWLGHSTFSALFGAVLGYWRERHARRGIVRAVLLAFAAAALLHACFDAIVLAGADAAHSAAPSPLATLLILLGAYLPLFAAQALLFRLLLAALAREAEIVRAYLAGEVLSGTVTPEEYATTQNATIRRAVERRLLISAGPRAYRLSHTLHQTIIGLATRKWHVAAGDPRKPGACQPEDAYRERIAALRRSLLVQTRAMH
jgi:RsiW-degrading membrane proteinase PrsW (M82 family)